MRKTKYYPTPLIERKKHYSFVDRLKRRYGLTVEEYYTLLKDANYKCEICLKDVKGFNEHSGTKDRACVDHDHEKDIVRGILCVDCNFAIGLLRNSSELCLNAAKYLEERK